MSQSVLKINDLPVSTVLQARLNIFQASKRPIWKAQKSETSWGTATVTGKIGQMHAGLVESIFFCAEKTRECDNGSIQLFVDPFKVRTFTYGGSKGSHQAIWNMLRDLMAVVIEFEVPAC
jgi:hypothetical protein